jgi:hypothetical protein
MFGSHFHQYGPWFLVSLVLALWAVFNIAQSPSASPFSKALWIVLVLFVPFFGFAIWLFFGPRARR